MVHHAKTYGMRTKQHITDTSTTDKAKCGMTLLQYQKVLILSPDQEIPSKCNPLFTDQPVQPKERTAEQGRIKKRACHKHDGGLVFQTVQGQRLLRHRVHDTQQVRLCGHHAPFITAQVPPAFIPLILELSLSALCARDRHPACLHVFSKQIATSLPEASKALNTFADTKNVREPERLTSRINP